MTMRFPRALAAALAVAATIVNPATAQEGVDNPTRNGYFEAVKGKKVVFIPMTMSVDLTIAWNDMMQRQAANMGYTVEVRDANWSTEAGARALTAAIGEKPDLIVLQNPDVQSYAKLIQRATAAGIPLIQLNMELLVRSDAYVGADWVGIGEIAGKEVAARCATGKGTSTKVQIIMGVPTGPSDLYQIYGFRKALADNPEIQIVSQQAAAYDPSKARAITASVLQQHPDLCASFGIWDSMDAGAGAAVKEAGKEKQVFVVTSGGGSETSCQKLREGIFGAMVAYDVRLQGAAINQQIAERLQSKATAGSESLTYYPPLKVLTADTLRPSSCWAMDDLQ